MLGRRLFGLVFMLISVFGWSQSQPPDRFSQLLQSAPSQDPFWATSKMTDFIEGLQNKRSKFKSDEVFLRYTFRETHKTFLHHYMAYSQFPELFESGNYDCLTATSLFSIVLDAFDVEYKIVETNYHIFLLAETNQKQILIESTDKTNGFVTDDRSINERLKGYRENKISAATADKYYYQFDLNLYQHVQPEQLTGLLYFNQAVTSFNENNLTDCALKLKKAIRIYTSPRVAEFAVILIGKVAESDLDDEEKKNLIKPFASFIKARPSIIAAR